MGIGALMNGGHLIPPTFMKRSEEEAKKLALRVVKPETSDKMRYLMRLNAEKGTAGKAEVKGYYIGGKTGTSEKVVGGRYSKTKLLNSSPPYAADSRAIRFDHAGRAAACGDQWLCHVRLESGKPPARS